MPENAQTETKSVFELRNYMFRLRAIGCRYRDKKLRALNMQLLGAAIGALLSIPITVIVLPNTEPKVGLIILLIAAIATMGCWLIRCFQSDSIIIEAKRKKQIPIDTPICLSCENGYLSLILDGRYALLDFDTNDLEIIKGQRPGDFFFVGKAKKELKKELEGFLVSQNCDQYRKIDNIITLKISLDNDNAELFSEKYLQGKERALWTAQ